MLDLPPLARFGGLLATGLLDVTADPAALDSTGFWAVCADFEGRTVCARFRDVRPAPAPAPVPGAWRGPARGAWTSSLDRAAYTAGVRRIRDHIAAGEVYQANLCRVLSAPLAPDADVDALTALLAAGNPAPYAGTMRLPGHGVEIATASPELFLRRTGSVVESGPIKGTGRTEADLLDKDHAENVMIVDLVRNDLGRVCVPGSVTVPDLCAVEKHPGLVHLVSTVRGELRAGTGWPGLLAAAFPPGSVTGAPKPSALRIIDALETAPRGPYCGGIGWVDADRGTGELAVGIRTFWADRAAGVLRFGTGAGITWGSEPEREWRETELKASRLLAIASGTYDDHDGSGTDDASRTYDDRAWRNRVKIWLDGGLQDIDSARVSVLDHGLTVGDGIFETVKAEGGRPFALTRHLDRLTRSARGLGLPGPRPRRDPPRLRRRPRGQPHAARPAAPHLHRRPRPARLGPRGPGHHPGRRPGRDHPAARLHRRDHRPLDPQRTRRPDRPEDHVVRRERRRPGPRPGTRRLRGAVRQHGRTAVRGHRLQRLRRPGRRDPHPARRLRLPRGHHRALTVEWTGAKETELPLDVLDRAEEVFLTSTLRDVQAVHRIDGRELPGAPGPVTTKAMRVFAERAADDLDP